MTDKQKRFAIEYANCGNATQAAKSAGYSEATAGSQGHALLKILEIQEFIEEIETQREQELRKKMAKEAAKAFNVLVDVMNNGKRDADKIKCAIDLLDRAGYGAEKKLEIKTNDDRSLERLKEDMAYDELRESSRPNSQ